jgi:hypothetical protein
MVVDSMAVLSSLEIPWRRAETNPSFSCAASSGRSGAPPTGKVVNTRPAGAQSAWDEAVRAEAEQFA